MAGGEKSWMSGPAAIVDDVRPAIGSPVSGPGADCCFRASSRGAEDTTGFFSSVIASASDAGVAEVTGPTMVIWIWPAGSSLRSAARSRRGEGRCCEDVEIAPCGKRLSEKGVISDGVSRAGFREMIVSTGAVDCCSGLMACEGIRPGACPSIAEAGAPVSLRLQASATEVSVMFSTWSEPGAGAIALLSGNDVNGSCTFDGCSLDDSKTAGAASAEASPVGGFSYVKAPAYCVQLEAGSLCGVTVAGCESFCDLSREMPSGSGPGDSNSPVAIGSS